MTDLRAIDPHDCGCTDCIVGEAVPFRNVTEVHLALFLGGLIRNRTHTSDEELRFYAKKELGLL